MEKRKFFYLIVATLVVSMVGIKFIGLDNIKNWFIRSPIAELYVEHIRDVKDFDADHVVTLLDNGTPIIVNKHDRCVCWFTRIMGYWDRTETKILKQIIKKDFKIIEVGSNFGVHTLRMAQLIGKQGRVYSFEANPTVSKYLKQSVDLNKLSDIVNVYERAAGDISGEAYLSFGLSNIGGGHLIPQALEGSVKTQIVRLDDVVKEDHIDLLKIDAEGYELKILKGAKNIIDKNAPNIILMMEWSQDLQENQGTKSQDLLNFLQPYGFKFWVITRGNKDKNSLVPVTTKDLLNIQVADIVVAREPLINYE